MIRVKNNLSPLCWLSSEKLLCYKQGCIVILKDGEQIEKYNLTHNWKEVFLGRINSLFRLYRLGIRAAVALDDNHVVLSIRNNIYELDVNDHILSNGWFCGEGIRPLMLATVKNIKGFEDGIYFGGYLGNKLKKPVNVFHRKGTDQWEVVYTFPQGVINHVHTIVADPYRNCLWIFTGDFGEAAAIWKITDNFKKVECVACNEQRYRACVVFALPEGLLYATDAPFAEDFIYMLNPDTMATKELFPIHGSCIYGCQWKDNYVFSSTVEGDGRNTSRKEFYFGRKRGAGIKDNYVHLYVGNPREGFKEIYKEKKDSMPYYTFQFGVFKFPCGVNNSDALYFQPVATKENDLRLMAIKDK